MTITGYHSTSKSNLDSIMSKGLLINQPYNLTKTGEWAKRIYKTWPLFFSLQPGTYKNDVILKVTNLDINYTMPDYPSLVDRGASLTEKGTLVFYDEVPELEKYMDDGEFNPSHVNDEFKLALINFTGTFAYLHNVSPENLSVVGSVNENALDNSNRDITIGKIRNNRTGFYSLYLYDNKVSTDSVSELVYSEQADKIHIEWMQTPEKYRKRGYGSALINDLKKRYPDKLITGRGNDNSKGILSHSGIFENFVNSLSPKKRYLGQCDRLRKDSCGEENWQNMMSNAIPVSDNEFINSVDMSPILDEDETSADLISSYHQQDPDASAYKSIWGDRPCLFYQVAGFEFIFVTPENDTSRLLESILEGYRVIFEEATGSALEQRIEPLAQEFANAAIAEYKDWISLLNTDPDTAQDVYAGGGICHLIADKIGDILNKAGGFDFTQFTYDHEQHVVVIAKLESDSGEDGVVDTVTIDVPWRLYEVGGGYSWEPLPEDEVEISGKDVQLYYQSMDIDNWESILDGI